MLYEPEPIQATAPRSMTATNTYGRTLTRAPRPSGVSVGSASIVVRIVGIKETPTTIEIMMPISTATSIRETTSV